MSTKRVKRLNSLLKEVISEVVRDDVDNPHVSTLITITDVDITTTNDLFVVVAPMVNASKKAFEFFGPILANLGNLASARGLALGGYKPILVVWYYNDLLDGTKIELNGLGTRFCSGHRVSPKIRTVGHATL